MGWISSFTERYDSEDAVSSEWEDTYEELPGRVADCNECRFLGSFTSEVEARKAIDRADVTGMGYARVATGKESARLRDAKALLEKERVKLRKFREESSIYHTHTGKTVGCKKCGSSFPVDYFKKRSGYFYDDSWLSICGEKDLVNHCPICGAEMRSDTALKRIDGYEKNIIKYQERVKALSEQEKNKPYFLGKIHAYCG